MDNYDDEMQEIQGYFLEEASELFDSSHSILLESEQSGELNSDSIDALFRNIHTLKGGSGSVELDYFAKYIHYLEDFIDSLRKGELTPSMAMIDFLLQELDILQEMIDEEANGNINKDEFDNKLSTLLKDIKSFNNVAFSEDETGISVESGQFIDLYDAVIETLHSVEDTENFDQEFVNDLFRHLHTLKGSSSFMGLTAFPKYLHNVENLLDQARNGLICYTNHFNIALIETMNNAEEIANDEFNNSLDDDEFNIKLKDVEELFDAIVEKCVNEEDENNSEDIGFELFEEDEKTEENNSSKEDVGFELFEEDKKTEESNSSKENVGFELFEEEKKEIEVVDSKIDIQEKQIIPKVVKAKNKKPKTNNNTIKKSAASNSIRVGLNKIDFLMNRVGDLVITKSMLYKFLEDLADKYEDPTIIDKLSRLDREIRELQEAVMSVRMIPMESVYSKLPKTIRDLAKKLNKKVNFIHHGDTVEIDKMMVEGLTDPLVHIIRNSLDHGIEEPDIRTQKGKDETGKLTISAAQESGHIIITIEDDGAGINLEKVAAKAIENNIITEKDAEHMSDEDKAMLIFAAGLSTSDEVSDVSGRGVGMDVVMNNITSIGGNITIDTVKNKGSKFTILLPLTLAILDGLNVKIGKEQLIMPLNMIVESLQPTVNMIKRVGSNKKEILMLRNEFIPIIRLYDFFHIEPEFTDITKGMLIITKITNIKVAIFVDDFLNQEQIVVKSLEKNYKKIKGISAATIRGDGRIGLILDIMNIIEEEKVRLWN